MVEGARLESVYGSKAHRGFESLPLRHRPLPQISLRLGRGRKIPLYYRFSPNWLRTWLEAKTYANGVVGIVSNAAAMARSKAMFSSSRLVPSSMVVP